MEIFISILKNGFILAIASYFVYLFQNIMYKESKQISFKAMLIIYVVFLIAFVLNDFYGFLDQLQ